MSSAFQIVARSGPTAGNIYALEKREIFIGRDLNNDIVINDPEVSRRHARMYLQGNAYILEDLGSTNGTMVNSQRITGTYNLNSGDVVTLGENITLVFEAPEVGHDAVTMVAGMEGEDATIRASERSPEPFAGQPAPPLQQATTPEPYAEPYGGQPQGGYMDAYGGQDPYGAQPDVYAGQIPDQPSEPVEGKRKLPVVLVVAIILLLVVCICGIGGFIIDTLELYCPLGGPVINMIWPGSCP